jgi:putative transposase
MSGPADFGRQSPAVGQSDRHLRERIGADSGTKFGVRNGMSHPRQVLPNSFYLITRRCTQRQFLIRPDAATNNAYLYCLIEAAQRFSIEIVMMCAMSNHHHLVIHDPVGRYPEFLEHLHKMFARSQNALRGRWENFWASGQTSVVRLTDPHDVLDKAVYVATNPVKDGLVERVHHWPGTNGYVALTRGRALKASRPRHFFRENGPMPEAVELTLKVPGALGDEREFLEALESRVAAVEETCALDRRQTGRTVVGRRQVLRQSWRDAPTSFVVHRGLNPRVAARNSWSRAVALAGNQWFTRAYQAARAAWIDGREAIFPFGTYWLRRFAHVPMAEA